MKSFNKIVAMLLLAVSFSAGAVVSFNQGEFLAATPDVQLKTATELLNAAKNEDKKGFCAILQNATTVSSKLFCEAAQDWNPENLTARNVLEVLKANLSNGTLATLKNGLGTVGNFLTDNWGKLTLGTLGAYEGYNMVKGYNGQNGKMAGLKDGLKNTLTATVGGKVVGGAKSVVNYVTPSCVSNFCYNHGPEFLTGKAADEKLAAEKLAAEEAAKKLAAESGFFKKAKNLVLNNKKKVVGGVIAGLGLGGGAYLAHKYGVNLDTVKGLINRDTLKNSLEKGADKIDGFITKITKIFAGNAAKTAINVGNAAKTAINAGDAAKTAINAGGAVTEVVKNVVPVIKPGQ